MMGDTIFRDIFYEGLRLVVATNYGRLVTRTLINYKFKFVTHCTGKNEKIFLSRIKKNTVCKIESVKAKSTTFNRIKIHTFVKATLIVITFFRKQGTSNVK